MHIYVDTLEAKSATGKIVAVCPTVGIEAEISEGYNIAKLRQLKRDLQEILQARLPECLGV